MSGGGGVTRLGTIEDGRIQRFFSAGDPEQANLSGASADARIVTKTPRTILVHGKEVKGWIVEMLIPSTDGVVRIDPNEEFSLNTSLQH